MITTTPDPSVAEAQGQEDELSRLAREIGEMTSDLGERRALEHRVDDRLREEVARILDRSQQEPGRTQDTKGALVDITDQWLPVAVLQQYYRVNSAAEDAVIRRLIRLSEDRDKKISSIARQALREAAASDIERLQRLGCRALLESNRLSDEELLGYASDQNVDMGFRIKAANKLTALRSDKGPDALLAVLSAWCELDDATRDSYSKQLDQLAFSFKNFSMEEAKAPGAVATLFDSLDDGRFARCGKPARDAARRTVQRALAALPEPSLAYMRALPLDSLTLGAVFALRRVVERLPNAAELALDWTEGLLRGDSGVLSPRGLLKELTNTLKNMRWPDDSAAERIASLKDLFADSEFCDDVELEQNVDAIGGTLARSEPEEIIGMVHRLGDDLEHGTRPDQGQCLALRRIFEKQYKRVSADRLSPVQKELLLTALQATVDKQPWHNSVHWFKQSYDQFRDHDRTPILDNVGRVASSMMRNADAISFRVLNEFLQSVAGSNNQAEASCARKWLEDITPAARPDGVVVS